MKPSRTALFVFVALAAIAATLLWPRPAPQPRGAAASTPAPAPVAAPEVAKPSTPATPGLAAVLPAPNPQPVAVVPAPTPAAPAAETIRQLRQDIRWQAPMPEPVFAQFRDWTQRFAAAQAPEVQAELLPEGLAIVEERRNVMADLIDQNPRRALELAVPAAVRRTLPADIVAQLEEPVAGRGDLWVAAALPMPGQELRVRPVQRTVEMKDGRKFDAFTFGQRDFVQTKMGIAVQGIALDGKLALTELPGRVLEPVEVQELHAASGATPICPTSGEVTAGQSDEVVVDWDGKEHTFFCGPQHALDSLIAASGLEAMAGGDGGGGPGAQSGATEGVKKLLIIRVDFPDQPGQVVSDATLTTLIGNFVTHWAEMSNGKMSWTALGAGSDFTPTLRLPLGHANYTGLGAMLAAARTAATAAGFNYTNYTHDVVVTGDKPDVGFGGVAYVGGRGAWLANGQWNLGVGSHEVGHNFGLNHAGFWDTTDGTTIGAGAAVEYGNPFDQMGGASSSMDAHFGARQKNYLDWLVDADVVKITANGTTTTRIRACDRSVATSDKAIAVDRTGTAFDYWIEYRQDYADTNLWARDGVFLNWGDVTINNGKPLLLDITPATSSKDDSPLLIGSTFSDTAAGIHITPILRGADVDGTTWVDVTVNRGTFPGNRKPTVTMSATNLNPAIGDNVTFTATATDPDGNPLAYGWDWGDGTFTANNLPTATKKWSTAGTRTVRCRVSDMKGLVATGQVLIQVGTSTTFFIQGTVTTTAGVLVENAVVRADSTHSDTTDTEGYYAITGLNAGSYTLTATKTGLSINAGNFTNPAVVGPNKLNVNFTAPPGSPYFSTMKAGLLDQGSNTGAVIVPVSDADTPIANLTLTGTSSNPAIIPDASITFLTVGSTVRTVTAAAASTVAGALNLTITATDPEGGTNSYVWPVTVNAKPVLAVTTQTTPENTPIDIDLRPFVTDVTPDDKIGFELQRVRDGTVTLLPDGYTARFTPAANYHGAASFWLTARDLSLGTRVLFLYDFDLPDVATDAKSTDQSNFNRTGTLEVAGVGGEYAYTADVPAALAPWSTQSLSVSEAGTGAARLRRTLAATDQNYNDADWSFSTWVKRSTRDTEDFILHLGSGDGHGTEAELELFFPANSDTLRLQKWGSAGLEKEIVGPNVLIGAWHHLCLVYDRTGTNVGTFTLYVDGFVAGTVASVTMDVSQSASLMAGGHNSTTASLDRWFDGKLEDVLFQSGLNGRSEVWGLSHFNARHYNGLSATATVNVTVTGANQAPTVTDLPDLQLPVSGVSAPLAFTVADPETEARSLSVVVTSLNQAVLPATGIALTPVPAAWTSGDIGAVGTAGSHTEDHGTFIVAGSGADIGGTLDEFRYVRQDISGDSTISARVVSMDFSNENAKAGVMLRSSSAANAAFALACVTPANGVTFLYRAADGGTAVVNGTVNFVAAPCWLSLVRVGGNCTAYYATDTNGVRGPWTVIGTTQAVTFGAAPNLSGLAVTSRMDAMNCTAVFDRLAGTVKLGGERTVTLTPASGVSGSTLVTLGAVDGALAGTDTFTLLVGPNSAPTISAVTNVVSTDGAAIASFNVTLSDVHSAATALTLTAASSNLLLLPASRIAITGSGAARTITLTPIPSETGTATVTLSSSDGSLTGTRTFTVTVNAGDPTFTVRSGANWRYHATGASPGATWFSTAFNDSAWLTAPAQLGYGDGDEGTVIPGGPTGARFITTYFRRTFLIANASQIGQAAIRLLCDDGALVFLNGQELARVNLTTGGIGNGTPATTDVAGANENAWQVFRFDPAKLVTGTNTFAVEVHQSSATSDDVSFDLQLLAYARTAIPQLTLTPQASNLNILWPNWATTWELKSSVDLQSWPAVSGTPTDNGSGQFQLTVPMGAAPKYYRLEAP